MKMVIITAKHHDGFVCGKRDTPIIQLVQVCGKMERVMLLKII